MPMFVEAERAEEKVAEHYLFLKSSNPTGGKNIYSMSEFSCENKRQNTPCRVP